MKINTTEFLAITALLASTTVATQACTSDDSSEPNENDAGASGGRSGSGGSAGKASGGTSGREEDGSAMPSTGGSATGGGAGSSAEAGSEDGGTGDGATADGSFPTDAADGAVACFGDETTLSAPDAGAESFTFCTGFPEGYCPTTLLNPVHDLCAQGELVMRPGVFEALLGCLRNVDVPSTDAGDAGDPLCDPELTEAALSCWTEAIDGACPSPTAPTEAGAGSLDCEAVHAACDGVSLERCEVANGALNASGSINQQTCFDFYSTSTDCVEAFETCLTDPFSE